MVTRDMTLAVARNIVNQVLDESRADVDTRQSINDMCDQFVARLIDDRVTEVLLELHVDVREAREKAWHKYVFDDADNGEVETLRQGKFEGITWVSSKIMKKLKEVRDVRNGRAGTTS